MKGMIFAAGVGSRLRPFTDSHPKALAPVGGKPMLRRVIEKMTAAGITRIVVNTHHFPGQITAYLEANDYFGADIVVSDESRALLDTGGGLLHARRFLDGDEPVVVHNADILTDFNIVEMLHRHLSENPLATLVAFPRRCSRQFFLDSAFDVWGWENIHDGERRPAGFDPSAPGLSRLAFGGVHIISPAIFPILESYAANAGDVFSIIPFYLSVIGKERVKSFHPSESFRWHDIGTPEKLAAAEQSFASDYGVMPKFANSAGKM